MSRRSPQTAVSLFDTPVLSGATYDIRVLTQPGDPEPQVCRVESSTGTVANSAVTAPTITCVTQHPRFAASLDFNDASYSSYVVDADSGQLRQLGFITTGDLPIDVTRDATERVSYVLSRGDATLTVFTRDSVTGELTEAPGSPYDTGAVPNPIDTVDEGPSSITAHPTLAYVYVANGAGANDIAGFAVDTTTGALTEIPGSPFAAGSRPFAISRDGKAAYIANAAADGHIQAVSVDASTGVFSTINDVGLVTNAVDTTGIPTAISVAPKGRFVYYTTQEGWGRARIDSASAGFTLPRSELINSPESRTAVAVHRDGRYLYLTLSSGSIERHELDPYTGSSVSLLTTATGTAPSSIAIDPTGRFLYTANSGSNNASAFTIAPSNGTLTLIDTDPPGANPIAAGPNPVSVRVDYSGRYVYVLSRDQNMLRSFEIKADGALMPTAEGLMLTGEEPNAIAVSKVVESPPPSGLTVPGRGFAGFLGSNGAVPSTVPGS